LREKLRNDLTDQRITDIVGENIFYIHAPEAKNLYIEYMFYDNNDSDFASNKNNSEIYYIQIDIFSSGDFTELENAIKDVMKEKGYIYINGVDGFEKETKLYTVKMRYKYKRVLA
jgi:hypothetical protein